MIILIRQIFIIVLFSYIKIYSQTSINSEIPSEIEKLIKEDNWEQAQFKLLNSNIKFNDISVSHYKLEYQLLFRINTATDLYRDGKFPEAEKSILASLKSIQNSKKNLSPYHYESLKHIAITRLFYTEKRLGNISKGLKYLEAFSKDLNPIYRKKQVIFFAVSYIEMGNYKKGLELLNQRLDDIRNDVDHHVYIKLSKELETAATYNTKGDAFIKWYKDSGESKYLDSSYHNYKNAYQNIKTIRDFSGYSQTLYYLRMANLSLLKKRYDYSLSLYNQCEKDSLFMNKNLSKEAVWVGKAEVYTHLKKTDSAFYYINRLYKKDKTKQFSSEKLLKIYHLLSINYENTGDSKMAYKFAKLSLSEIDKIKSQNVSGNLLLGKHEQQEIQFFSEEMLRKDKRKVILLAALFISLVVIAFVRVYRAYKKKKKIISEYEIKLSHSEKNTGSYIEIEKKLIIKILSKLDQLENKKKFLSNDFKLTTIAKQLNTNTAYLSQIINEYKKTSFSDYVHNLRIYYAVKELNRNPVFRKYTIQTISEEVGYKSPTTFVKAFKDRIQLTPSEYIRQLESENF